MWGMIGSLLGEESNPRRTNLDSRKAYFQKLMSNLYPGYTSNFYSNKSVSSGGGGDLMSLLNMLGGGNDVGDRYSFSGSGERNQSVFDNNSGRMYNFDLSSWNNY
jgi:hypothetical protein